NDISVAKERIIDTFVGSIIALMASFIVLPNWESHQFRNFMLEALKANYYYFLKAARQLSGEPVDIMSYKLVRKDVYVSSANLGSAFQRMLSEPKNRQKNSKETHTCVVLNHMLSSYIATLVTNLQQSDNPQLNENHIKLIRRSLYS